MKYETIHSIQKNSLTDEELEAARKSGTLPTHEDGERVWCCGWADHMGLMKYGYKVEINSVCYYYESENVFNESGERHITCYLEFPLSESQVDIVKELIMTDAKSALSAVVTYAGDELLVPEEHAQRWASVENLVAKDQDD